MKNTWKAIQEEIKKISPAIAKSFNPPATLEEIEKLEKHIGVELPSSFKEYLQCFNGQKHKNFDICFINSNCLLPIKEIIKTWDLQNKLFEDEEVAEKIENKVVLRIWDKGWIPFTNSFTGEPLLIDLNPGKNGLYGQIQQYWAGRDLRNDDIIMGDSFEEFSLSLLSELQSGNYEFDDDTIELTESWII